MGEEGVESFKDISFVSEPIGEVGVIVNIKEPLVMAMAMAFKTLLSTAHTNNIYDHAIPLSIHTLPLLTAFHNCQTFLLPLYSTTSKFFLFIIKISKLNFLTHSRNFFNFSFFIFLFPIWKEHTINEYSSSSLYQ